MDRRTFLISSGVAAAAATQATAETEVAAPAVRRSMEPLRTMLSPRFQSGYLRDRADRFALRVKELSDGRISLSFTLDDEDSGLKAISGSRADAYFGTEADHIAQHPAFAYFAGLPGEHGLSGDHFATWLTAGSGQLHWDQLADGFGIKALPVGHSGRAPGLWAKADLDRLPDFAGRTVNASPLATAVAKELGAVPAAGDDGDLREVPMGITAAVADGVAKHHKVWFPDGIHWQGLAQSFGMQAGLWHGLSDSDRAIISSCASESYHQCLAEHDAHDKAVAPHLFASQGIARRPLPDDVRRAIAHVAEGLVLHAATQHEATANVHESYMLFRQSFVGDPPIGVAGALV